MYNTQEFPDFMLHPKQDDKDLLELKVFDGSKSPNFDIANFDAYVRSLRQHAYRLHADYLIFAYLLDDEGVLQIKDIWLKKIWELSGPSGTRPIKVQEKQNKIVNLRPAVWFSTQATYNPFSTMLEFVVAIKDTLKQTEGKQYANAWFDEVNQNYKEKFRRDIF